MIWVIGDIHGMLDPLKKIITEIRKLHYLWNQKVEKIIFLGDYIDYGPSSKEVIELLLGLEFDTVFLAGNHEDLFLQYFHHSDLFKKYGNIYFRGNGGQETLYSFFPNKKSYHGIYEDLPLEYADFKLEEKYLSFFNNLQYSHTECIKTNGREYKFVFAHAGLDLENDITEQLALKNYDDFHHYIKEKNIWVEKTLLWTRKEPSKRFGDFILVHGHTPTGLIDRYYDNILNYSTASHLPFLKFDRSNIEYPDAKTLDYKFNSCMHNIISINIDTGIVLGNRLTALGLCGDDLEKNSMSLLQVDAAGMYRDGRNTKNFTIQFENRHD